VIAALVFIGLTTYVLISLFKSNQNPWLGIFLLIPGAVIIGLAIFYSIHYYAFRDEAYHISFKDQRTVSINIKKVYKRLKVGHINVN
jgi:uncharacterized membrane-anchored protein